MNKMIFKNAAGFGWGFILGFNVLRLMEGQKPEAEKKPTTEKPIEISATNKPAEPINEPPKTEPIPNEKSVEISVDPIFIGQTDLPAVPVIPDGQFADLHRWRNFGSFYRFLAPSGIFIFTTAAAYFYLRYRGLLIQHYDQPTYWTNLATEIRNYTRQNRPVSYPSDDPEARQEILKTISENEELNNMADRLEKEITDPTVKPLGENYPGFFGFGEDLNILPSPQVKTRASKEELLREFENLADGEEIIIFGENEVEIPETLLLPANGVEITTTETKIEEIQQKPIIEEEIPIIEEQTEPPQIIVNRGRQNVILGPSTQTLQIYKKEEKPIISQNDVSETEISNFSQGLAETLGGISEAGQRYGPLILGILENIREGGALNLVDTVKKLLEIKKLAESDSSEISAKITEYFKNKGQILGSAQQENYISPDEPFQFILLSGSTDAANFRDILNNSGLYLDRNILDRVLADPSFFMIYEGERIEGIINIFYKLRAKGLMQNFAYTNIESFFKSYDFDALMNAFIEGRRSPLIKNLQAGQMIGDRQILISLQFTNFLFGVIRAYMSLYGRNEIRNIRSISAARAQLNIALSGLSKKNSILFETSLYSIGKGGYRITDLRSILNENFSNIGDIIITILKFLNINKGKISSELYNTYHALLKELFANYTTEIGSTREKLLKEFQNLSYVEYVPENSNIVDQLNNLKLAQKAVKAYFHAMILLGFPVQMDENDKAVIRGKYQKK
jgi:hypothetical protein